jgi:hypothetical protein
VESGHEHGAKMCATLSYGDRQTFVAGIDDLIELSTLSMAHEWSRYPCGRSKRFL